MLTGLPIMGAILDRQNNTDFSALQLFASVSAIAGAGLLVASTYFVAKTRKLKTCINNSGSVKLFCRIGVFDYDIANVIALLDFSSWSVYLLAVLPVV
jgi:hypothetical protein